MNFRLPKPKPKPKLRPNPEEEIMLQRINDLRNETKFICDQVRKNITLWRRNK